MNELKNGSVVVQPDAEQLLAKSVLAAERWSEPLEQLTVTKIVEEIAQVTGQAFEAVAQSVANMAREMSKTKGAESGLNREQIAAQVRKEHEGVPLERWDTRSLMSQLPERWHDGQLKELTFWQLVCRVQHVLNNCERAAPPATYNEALVSLYGPELVQRIEAELAERDRFARFQSAWTLYRSGEATLEEVTGFLDKLAATGLPTSEVE